MGQPHFLKDRVGIEMKATPKRYYEGKPVVEIDFLEGKGWFVELARTAKDSQLVLILKGDGIELQSFMHFPVGNFVACPPEENEISRHVRFTTGLWPYGSVENLLNEIESFFTRCLDLDGRDRFLLACFVLSTWLVDRLRVAPYVALVGLPRSGKTTALSVLQLLCYRGLITSDISSAAFYRACDRWKPTLLIDEAATAGPKQRLFHLLRSGTTQNAIAFRMGHSYRSYGAKVVAWTEMPDDDALNSRCITIPMHETSRTDLQRTTDPDLVAAADKLQRQLMKFRLENYHTLKLVRISGDERLRSRDRDLFEALALPIGKDPKACARLLELMEVQRDFNREPLPPRQTAVLESLFKQIHLQPDQEAFSLQNLKKEVNSNLVASGERFHLNEKSVSSVLKSFGFLERKRTSSGFVVLVDRAMRKRVHELLLLYGLNGPSACLPPGVSGETCEFCKPQETRTPEPHLVGQVASEIHDEPAPPVVSGPNNSERSERDERSERENSGDEEPFSTEFIGPGDRAIIERLQEEPPQDWIDEHPDSSF